jgi:hypothetical protein
LARSSVGSGLGRLEAYGADFADGCSAGMLSLVNDLIPLLIVQSIIIVGICRWDKIGIICVHIWFGFGWIGSGQGSERSVGSADLAKTSFERSSLLLALSPQDRLCRIGSVGSAELDHPCGLIVMPGDGAGWVGIASFADDGIVFEVCRAVIRLLRHPCHLRTKVRS